LAKRRNILGNRQKKNAEHLARTEGFVRNVQQIFDFFNKKAARIALSTDFDPEKEFKWADFPAIKSRLNTLTSDWVKSLNLTITSGIRAEWSESNKVHDDTLKRFFDAHTYTQQKKKGVRKYFEYNKDAVESFIERKTKGLNLSERLWNLREDYKNELEAAIATGIEKGTSAAQLSKKLSQYLKDFPKLQNDYSEKFGKQVDIKNCENNAARLARTEINMSYREAEWQRWQNEDFVVGYEIKRSGTPYPCPVCEALQGKYPKDFKWNGWHPNCRCYQIPILKTEEEFWADEGGSTKSKNEITDMPDNFKDWVKDNNDRLAKASIKGSLPDWVSRNQKVMYSIDRREEAEELAKFYSEIKELNKDKNIVDTPRKKRLEDEYRDAEYQALMNPSANTVFKAFEAMERWKEDISHKFLEFDYDVDSGVKGMNEMMGLYFGRYLSVPFKEYKVANSFPKQRTIAITDGAGAITVREDYHKRLVAVMKKMQRGDTLNKGDEDAIEAVYHEVRHNIHKTYTYEVNSVNGLISEATNEITARNNYAKFVDEIGGAISYGKSAVGYSDVVDSIYDIVDITKTERVKFDKEVEKALLIRPDMDISRLFDIIEKVNPQAFIDEGYNTRKEMEKLFGITMNRLSDSYNK